MPALENAKRERFCREYVIDGNGAQAAIRAGYSAKAAKVQASQLLTIPNVQARVVELRSGVAERLEITQESVLLEIEETRKAAAKDQQHGVALKASELKGKHIGMWPAKTPDGGAGEGLLRILEEMARARLEREQKTIEHGS